MARRKRLPAPSHDQIEAAVAHFIALAVEALLGVEEISKSLDTGGTLAFVAQALLKHRDQRARYVRTAIIADMLPAIYNLMETERSQLDVGGHVISRAVMREKITNWARRRNLELTRAEVEQIIAGKIERGAKTTGKRERIDARAAKVAKVSQPTLQKTSRASRRALHEALGIRSPDEFERAVADRPPPKAWLLYYVLVALAVEDEQCRAIFRALKLDIDTVRSEMFS